MSEGATTKELRLGTVFYARLSKDFEAVTQRAEALLNRYRNAAKNIETQLASIQKASGMQATAVSNLESKVNALSKKSAQVGNVIPDITREKIENADMFARAMKNLGEAFMTILKYGAAYKIITGIADAFHKGTDAVLDFDQGMVNLKAMSGETGIAVKAMGDIIREIAGQKKFNANELSESMVKLSRAGFQVAEANEAIRPTSDAAAGTLSDLDKAADAVSTQLRAFALNSLEAGRVADVMTNAVTGSKLDIERLGTIYNYLASSASQAGLSLEEFHAVFMVFADMGMKASTSATGFRNVLAQLLSPSKKLRVELEKMGMSTEDLDVKTVGFETALGNLSRVLWDSDKKTVDMGKAFDIFGKRGANAAAAIVDSFNKASYDDALSKVYETGTAAKKAAEQTEGARFKLKNLGDNAANLAISFGDKSGLTQQFKNLVSAVTEAIKKIDAFVNTSLGGLFTKTLLVAGSLKLLTMAFTGLRVIALGKALFDYAAGAALVVKELFAVAKAAGKARAAMWLLNGVGWANAFVIIATAIAGVIMLLDHLSKSYERAAEAAGKAAISHEMNYRNTTQFLDVLQKAEGTKEYDNAVKRMTEHHGDLMNAVLKSAGANSIAETSYDDLKKSIEEVRIDELTSMFEENKAAVMSSGKDIERLGLLLKNAGIEVEDFSEITLKMAESAGINWNAVQKANRAVKNQADYITELKKSLVLLYQEGKKTPEESFGIIKSLVQQGALTKKAGEEIIASLEQTYTRIEERAKLAKERMAALQKDLLPDKYADYVKNLTPLRATEFNAFMEDLHAKIKNHQDANAQMLQSTEKRYADEAAIKAGALAKHVLEQEKWILAEEERYSRELSLIDDYVNDSEELYDSRVSRISRSLDELVYKTDLSVRDRAEAEKRFREEEERAERQHTGEMLGLAETYIDGLKRRYAGLRDHIKAIWDEIRGLEQTLYDDIRSIHQLEMSEEEKWLDDRAEARKIAQEAALRGDAAGYQNAYNLLKGHAVDINRLENEIAKNRQQTADDVRKAEEKLARARSAGKDTAVLEQELAFAKKAQADYEAGIDKQMESARERNTAIIAEMTEYNEKARGILKKRAEDEKNAMDAIEEQVKKFEDLMARVNAAGNQKITLDVKGALDEIQKVAHALSDMEKRFAEQGNVKPYIFEFKGEGSTVKPISEKIDEIRTKLGSLADIQPGSVSVDVSGLDEAASATKKFLEELDRLNGKHTESYHTHYIRTVEQKRMGGLVGNLMAGVAGRFNDGVTRFRERLAFRVGGRLPGYGGGDRVPVLAEAGEFIIRKEAVRKYGHDLFALLNSMIPDIPDFSGTLYRRMGGAVSFPDLPMPAPQRFAAGGMVANTAPQMTDYGKIEITMGGASYPVFSSKDVISALKDAITKEQLTRRR